MFANTYQPIQGKTYSLFANGFTTFQYFIEIDKILDKLLKNHEIQDLLEVIQEYQKIPFIKKLILKERADLNIDNDISEYIFEKLSPFTQKSHSHVTDLSRLKFNDRVLWTTEKQLQLQMLEIALANRINLQSFKACDHKIALLPRCLRENDKECLSQKDEFDPICKNCSQSCYLGTIGKFLKSYNITPYIWSGKSFKTLVTKYEKQGQKLGILGIACIPELSAGIKTCLKYKIPVIGMPLNANRCERWMGSKMSNSVDLAELEKMLEN